MAGDLQARRSCSYPTSKGSAGSTRRCRGLSRLRGGNGAVAMRMNQGRWAVLACSGGLAGLLAAVATGVFRGRDARADAELRAEAGADPAVERTREQVKMLDDLYKTAVVAMTKRYVREQDEQPAIKVAQDVFGAMRKQGWHSAKLV